MFTSESHLNFHKSSYSTTAQECVEVAESSSGAAVRDTEDRESGHLAFPSLEWAALLRSATGQ